MNNDISGLRDHLFLMLKDLRDPEKKLELERYRLANDVAQTVINSAKVEVDYMRQLGGKSASGFIPANGSAPPPALTDDSSKD